MSLKHAMLVLLETEPGSGYDLLKHFKNSLGYFWNARHQQIYQQLKQLNQEGLISCKVEKQNGKPDKKVYAITPSGIRELKTWLAAPKTPNKINDALLVKLYGGHLLEDHELLTELDHHIDIHTKTLSALKKIEQRFLNLKKKDQVHYRLPYLTLRRGIIGEEAWLTWAEEAKKAIKK